jgi:multiple sugar transport system ATP-binding protein
MSEIALQDVTKVYDDGTQAVTDVNLDIPDGRLMVLVGPSGCGKTTLLRMVAGLEEITSGMVRIGDRVVNDIKAKDRDIAMVFQNYALYPHMSVYENMAVGLKLRKMKKQEIHQRVTDAARVLGLDEMLKKKPGKLSGGQRQRVAMGRAIVREPKAFLMDEPLSNLDAKLRVQMRGEISRIQRDVGVTTIYVTHDQTEAMTLGDRVAVLRKGLLQQVDSPQNLYRRPANLFVAGFIGSPSMNLAEARIEQDEGQALCASFAEHRLELGEATLAQRPALRSYLGQPVVVGIRPEALADAALQPGTPADRRLRAVIDLREDMGHEIFVHFTVNIPAVITEDTRELASDLGDDALTALEQDSSAKQSIFVARFSPDSRVQEGDTIDVVVDTAALHFFDPGNGRAIVDQPRATDPIPIKS